MCGTLCTTRGACMMEKIESLAWFWLVAIINRPHHHSLRPHTLPSQYVLHNGGGGLPLTCLHSNKQIADSATHSLFGRLCSNPLSARLFLGARRVLLGKARHLLRSVVWLEEFDKMILKSTYGAERERILEI
jgi:hypothetical protein